MKIKNITCHDVYNYGASLQAYALQQYLTELGHEVQIIDYFPDYMDVNYRIRWNKYVIPEVSCIRYGIYQESRHFTVLKGVSRK